MPRGLDITRPSDWLLPVSPKASPTGTVGLDTLQFVVAGSQGGITVRPYFEIQQRGEMFTNYPCFQE